MAFYLPLALAQSKSQFAISTSNLRKTPVNDTRCSSGIYPISINFANYHSNPPTPYVKILLGHEVILTGASHNVLRLDQIKLKLDNSKLGSTQR